MNLSMQRNVCFVSNCTAKRKHGTVYEYQRNKVAFELTAHYENVHADKVGKRTNW